MIINRLLEEVDQECAKNASLVLDKTERLLVKKATKGQLGCEQYCMALGKYIRARITEKRLKTVIKRRGHTQVEEQKWLKALEIATELKREKDAFL